MLLSGNAIVSSPRAGGSFCAWCRMELPDDELHYHLSSKFHRKRARQPEQLARRLLYRVYQQAGAEAELRTARAVLALPSPAWRLLEASLEVPQEFLRTYFGGRPP